MPTSTLNKGSNNQTKSWDHFVHDADIGIRGWGNTPRNALENAALALTGVITDPSKIRSSTKILITDHLSSDNKDLLLYDWLNAIVFCMATEGMVFGKYHIEEKDGAVRGWGWGEPIDEVLHDPAVEVKGATMTGLSLAQRESDLWIAECVVDV
jgi:SHS2 domain-containing protein